MAIPRALAAAPTRPRSARAAALVRELVLLLAASVFLALTARISVSLPFSPVPLTGQTLGVLLIGAIYGPRRGTLAVFLYLAEGAAGAPVFSAGRGGLAHILGPSGGYLAGFLPAAAIAGLAAPRPIWLRFAGMILAGLAVYVVGLAWLTVLAPPASLAALLATGVLPFLPGDALKAALVAGVTPAGAAVLARLGVRPR
jgi:biotin transport system substrate-specific component